MLRMPVIPTQCIPYSHIGDSKGAYYAVSVDRNGECIPLRISSPGRGLSLITVACPDQMKKRFTNSTSRVCLDGQANSFITLRENKDRTYSVIKTHIDINTGPPRERDACLLYASVSSEDVWDSSYVTVDVACRAVELFGGHLRMPFCPRFWMAE